MKANANEMLLEMECKWS